ncbi:hypothetical protein EDD16DRAFT_1516822 [Pisolithus croceorrhizus]|nr:hypothetical protein EDD16DRAFT_1516822 [Pisolithus croceorrhizus]KAI6167689.1 hypothetical protein EDD17DRAFT_1503929 [Pisolithus thermaeus]
MVWSVGRNCAHSTATTLPFLWEDSTSHWYSACHMAVRKCLQMMGQVGKGSGYSTCGPAKMEYVLLTCLLLKAECDVIFAVPLQPNPDGKASTRRTWFNKECEEEVNVQSLAQQRRSFSKTNFSTPNNQYHSKEGVNMNASLQQPPALLRGVILIANDPLWSKPNVTQIESGARIASEDSPAKLQIKESDYDLVGGYCVYNGVNPAITLYIELCGSVEQTDDLTRIFTLNPHQFVNALRPINIAENSIIACTPSSVQADSSENPPNMGYSKLKFSFSKGNKCK